MPKRKAKLTASQIAEAAMKADELKSARLILEYWPTDRLIAYEKNPRKHAEGDVGRLVSSINEFGFAVPILARSDGTIIDGHLRHKAAKRMMLGELPVILCDEWTEAQIKAFRLLANKSVSWSEWDDELLKLEFADLKLAEFNLQLTGFEIEEFPVLSELKLKDIGFQDGKQSKGSISITFLEEHRQAIIDELKMLAAKYESFAYYI